MRGDPSIPDVTVPIFKFEYAEDGCELTELGSATLTFYSNYEPYPIAETISSSSTVRSRVLLGPLDRRIPGPALFSGRHGRGELEPSQGPLRRLTSSHGAHPDPDPTGSGFLCLRDSGALLARLQVLGVVAKNDEEGLGRNGSPGEPMDQSTNREPGKLQEAP